MFDKASVRGRGPGALIWRHVETESRHKKKKSWDRGSGGIKRNERTGTGRRVRDGAAALFENPKIERAADRYSNLQAASAARMGNAK